MISIYGIFSKNRVVYVGQTINGKHRFEGHHVKKKYPEATFKILATTLKQDIADNFERDMIDLYDLVAVGENVSTGGLRGSTFRMSDEGRKKISDGLKGKPKSKEHIKNMPTKFKKGNVTWNTGTRGLTSSNKTSFPLGKPFYILKDGKIVGEYEVQSKCAHEFNIHQAKISLCLKGERKSHKGYTFKYSEK